jgi:hypothetical protein
VTRFHARCGQPCGAELLYRFDKKRSVWILKKNGMHTCTAAPSLTVARHKAEELVELVRRLSALSSMTPQQMKEVLKANGVRPARSTLYRAHRLFNLKIVSPMKQMAQLQGLLQVIVYIAIGEVPS